MELKSLNNKQIEAVRATEGRVRIIAGAGSGKTRVLAYSMRIWLRNWELTPGISFALLSPGRIPLE